MMMMTLGSSGGPSDPDEDDEDMMLGGSGGSPEASRMPRLKVKRGVTIGGEVGGEDSSIPPVPMLPIHAFSGVCQSVKQSVCINLCMNHHHSLLLHSSQSQGGGGHHHSLTFSGSPSLTQVGR